MFRPKRPRERDEQNLQDGARFRGILSLMVCSSARSSEFPQRGEQTPQTEMAAPNAAVAVRVDHGPKMDGALDDPLWQLAKTISDFRQQEPYEGQPATERTEVRILYSRHAVYFGIHCFDSDPPRIIASELRRDVSQDLDDHFEILIDSNHNRRGAYVFQVNPLGTQMDGLIVEEQRDNSSVDFDSGWDGVWTSEARIGADGLQRSKFRSPHSTSPIPRMCCRG